MLAANWLHRLHPGASSLTRTQSVAAVLPHKRADISFMAASQAREPCDCCIHAHWSALVRMNATIVHAGTPAHRAARRQPAVAAHRIINISALVTWDCQAELKRDHDGGGPFRPESGETSGAAGDFAADDANTPVPISGAMRRECRYAVAWSRHAASD